jgi:hypothetical protein
MNDRRMDDWADSQSEILEELSSLMRADASRKALNAELREQSAEDHFLQVQAEIKNSPLLLKTFKALKERFITDPIYRAGTDEGFVECVEMMDLSEGDD